MSWLIENVGRVPSKQEVLAVAVAGLQADSAALFGHLVQRAADMYRFVWSNPAFTPQELFDQMQAEGKPAAQLFADFGALVALINALRPDTIDATPPVPCAANKDGSITVSVWPPPAPQAEPSEVSP